MKSRKVWLFEGSVLNLPIILITYAQKHNALFPFRRIKIRREHGWEYGNIIVTFSFRSTIPELILSTRLSKSLRLFSFSRNVLSNSPFLLSRSSACCRLVLDSPSIIPPDCTLLAASLDRR